MCLILLSYLEHPDYPLVVAANRDELYARPTRTAHFWDDAPHILGGRDLQALGTWLAVDRSGRFTALSNHRDPQAYRGDARSRGEIVVEFLRNQGSGEEYLRTLAAHRNDYNGYNLILGEGQRLWYYTNRREAFVSLAPGCYGLSNAFLDDPWPKLESSKSRFQTTLAAGSTLPVEQLFDILSDRSVPDDGSLPWTGLDLKRERALAAVFVQTPDYGTRCSTVLSISRERVLSFVERSFDPDGKTTGTIRYDLALTSTTPRR